MSYYYDCQGNFSVTKSIHLIIFQICYNMLMKTPVLIPARNEAAEIGLTLAKLDSTVVEPIVIVNATKDNTADIARHAGATVLESEPGKMPAMQEGLRYLAARHIGDALGPVLITDADTHPLYPHDWPSAMRAGLRRGPIVSGLYVAREGDLLTKSLMSGLRVANVMQKIITGKRHMSGMNMMLELRSLHLLDAILDLPNVWPGEDLALAWQLLRDENPPVTCNPRAVVKTSSRFLPGPLSIAFKGKSATIKETDESRRQRGPAGSIPFDDFVKQQTSDTAVNPIN